MIKMLKILLKKLEDINNNIDKKIVPKKMFKEIGKDLDRAISSAKGLQQSVDIFNKNDNNAVDIIKCELISINNDYATRLAHDYKELLEVFIGKYRKVRDRMDVFNYDE